MCLQFYAVSITRPDYIVYERRKQVAVGLEENPRWGGVRNGGRTRFYAAQTLLASQMFQCLHAHVLRIGDIERCLWGIRGGYAGCRGPLG